MDDPQGAAPTGDHPGGDSQIVSPLQAHPAHDPERSVPPSNKQDEAKEKGWYVPKRRRRKAKAYFRKFGNAGPDRHVELIIAFLVVLFAFLQYVNSLSSSDQMNKLLSAATQIQNAGWTFSGAAIGINNAGWNAVSRLQDQADQVKRSAAAAEKSIKATQQEMRLDERAWVSFDGWVLSDFSVGRPVGLTIMFLNRGKTPAMNVRFGYRAGRVISNDHTPAEISRILREEVAQAARETRPANTMPPGVGDKLDVDPIHSAVLDQGRFDAVAKGVSTWYETGIVTYDDVFHRHQWTTYCLQLEMTSGKPEVFFCNSGNDMSH